MIRTPFDVRYTIEADDKHIAFCNQKGAAISHAQELLSEGAKTVKVIDNETKKTVWQWEMD